MGDDHTISVGHVHVGRYTLPPYSGDWVCADDCPHPDHRAAALYKEEE